MTLPEILALPLGEFNRLFLEPRGWTVGQYDSHGMYCAWNVPKSEVIALRHRVGRACKTELEVWESITIPPQLWLDAMDDLADNLYPQFHSYDNDEKELLIYDSDFEKGYRDEYPFEIPYEKRSDALRRATMALTIFEEQKGKQ